MVLFTILLIGVGIGVAGASVYYRDKERKRLAAGVCAHIAWTPWRPVPIMDGWGKGVVVGVGERRECLACNHSEIMEVVTS